MTHQPPFTTVSALLERYDVFFLDAYGVLVSAEGSLPHAAEFLQTLTARKKTWMILSNDASRSPQTCSASYARKGLQIEPERVLTSGMLIENHFQERGLRGARTIVLGTPDSADYVRKAGGVVVPADDDNAEVLVVADDDGFDFLPTMNAAVSTLFRRIDRKQQTHLLLPNPDIVFPMGPGRVGITAGAIAAAIEACLDLRDADGRHRFVGLGKPHTPIFKAAQARCGNPDPRRTVMLGDQLATDVRGAHDAGLDVALLLTGVSRAEDIAGSSWKPTWILNSLDVRSTT